jgi:hypothetical protein
MTVQLVPSQFILLASISTLMKAIGGMINGTVKATANRHFASRVEGKNLGDITAKGQSQGVFAYTIGMLGGIGLSYLCVSSPFYIGACFLGLNTSYLLSGYCLLRNLNSKFLNDQRGRMVVRSYLATLFDPSQDLDPFEASLGKALAVPYKLISPQEVSQQENFIKSYKPKIPLVVGVSVETLSNNDQSELQEIILHTYDRDSSDPENFRREKYLLDFQDGKIVIAVEKSATEVDYIRAYYHSQVLLYYLDGQPERTRSQIHQICKHAHRIMCASFTHFINSLKHSDWGTDFVLLHIHPPRYEFMGPECKESTANVK